MTSQKKLHDFKNILSSVANSKKNPVPAPSEELLSQVKEKLRSLSPPANAENIQVCLRIRPFLKTERRVGIWNISGNTIALKNSQK